MKWKKTILIPNLLGGLGIYNISFYQMYLLLIKINLIFVLLHTTRNLNLN